VPDVASPVLVGRERELALLRSGMSATAAGQPGVVLVGGEAGVGKSRLLEAALTGAAAHGFSVLTGGCIELGGEGLPFVPLVEALRTLVQTTPPDELDRLLGPARRELGRLLPELASGLEATGAPGGSTAQLFELVLGVLGRLGRERPLVLVIEDLHWADRSTLDLVAFLVRGLRTVRVLLVLTFRSDEVDRRSPLRPLLSGWERQRGVERLELARFVRAEVATQVSAILGGPAERALVDQIFDRSEGNPFFVEELVRTLRDGSSEDELPPSLRDVLLIRVERLSRPAQRLLRTAAVAGRWVPERLLAAVADVSAAELYEGLREAVDASLLVVERTSRGYSFRHALTRDAVYEELLPGERTELHTAYAETLDRDPGLAGDDGSVAATLAVHWYAAHDLPRALAASVRAGRQALAAFAPAEARRHLERVLEVWRLVPDAEERAGADQVEVLVLTARATHDAGDADRALALLERAEDYLGPDPDPERLAGVIEQRAWCLRSLGDDAGGYAHLERALARLPAKPPSLARASVMASMANALMRMNMTDEAWEIARTARDAARSVGARALEASALTSLGVALTYLSDPAEGERALREGLRIALEVEDHNTALRAYVNLSDILESLGRHREAADAARLGMELASRVGLTRTFGAYLVGNLVEPLVRLGEWAEADELARETLTAELIGVFGASLHELIGYLSVHRGRPDEALGHVREARRQLGESTEAQFLQALLYIEAEAARASGDLEHAGQLVRQGLSRTTAWSGRYAWPLVWLGARIEADAAIRARDRQEAPSTTAVPDGSGIATSFPAARAYRDTAAAEVARAAGDPAVPAWQDAVAAWREATDLWPLTYSLYRLAEAYCAAGRREEACAPLREAAGTARRLGARPLLDDAEALARRARLPIDDHPPEAPAPPDAVPFALTEREREVLGLVAAGRTNGQIAAALFISPKTASVHVSNILAKLGVSGRVEAAAVAHRLGLVASPD
jgi:DNA-binding CsgD family transcriptional regulator/tetratricopeptide (TPR) repeat protein